MGLLGSSTTSNSQGQAPNQNSTPEVTSLTTTKLPRQKPARRDGPAMQRTTLRHKIQGVMTKNPEYQGPSKFKFQIQIPSSNSKTNKVQIPKRTPAASKPSLSSDASKSGVMGGLSPMMFFPTHRRSISGSISDSASTRLGRPQVPVHANTSKSRCTTSSSTYSCMM